MHEKRRHCGDAEAKNDRPFAAVDKEMSGRNADSGSHHSATAKAIEFAAVFCGAA